MSAAVAPRPAPVARLRLQRVQARGMGRPAGAPVFHVFEELFTRALEHQRARPEAPRAAPRP
ncbi:MAG TPA: hypothetical protein VFK85_08600 [Anaeromyxobacteraceae bacterium]|nr:hypothetical protein [Anaeromyxobacteraceae bacterium]